MKEKKKGKTLKGLLIGLGVIVIIGLLFGVTGYFFTGGPAQVTIDVGQYEETMRKYTSEVAGKVHTGFFTFPEQIPASAFENGSEPIFYFSYQDTWDDPTCEVYLKCRYSDDDYASETERLRNSVYMLKGAGNEVTNKLKYEESERFVRPVYMAIDCDNHSYEYAMDLGNNEIAYIYTSFTFSPDSLKVIPEEYLPSDFTESIENNTYSNGGYNVYVVEKTDEYTLLDYGDKHGGSVSLAAAS
ncbi:MAG: hypothetical protein IKD96_00935 [Oscillospiraceae bacterium]|nr:hypothetical protein [Oscillospiraceae bacterium]MBR6350856.1 hypothetical protein [Bacillota bacterium]